jgi:DNA-binding CsgD family transcriptional regulator
MGCEFSTLLDILNSQQFRTVLLFAAGLDMCQIADLLDTSERTVCSSLEDCFHRLGCRSKEGLATRLRYEFENGLYDERLEKQLGYLQDAAKRFLEKEESTSRPSALIENRATSSPEWVM